MYLAVDPPGPSKAFFQRSGTLVLDAASNQLNGTVSETLTDVTLVEVTISDTSVSTPVPGGVCPHIAPATVSVLPSP